MGVYIDGVDMPKGETTELIIRVQPNGEIRDSQGILLKLRAEDIDLVRCGECKWCDDKGKGRALICTNPYIDMDIHPLDFCSYGERRAE